MACALVIGAIVFWAGTGGSAQAVPTTTSVTLPLGLTITTLPLGITTTTTEFTLQGQAKTQVDALQAQADQVQAQLDNLDDQLDQKTEEYNKCLEDLDACNARLGELRRTVADAQTEKAQRQAMFAARIKAMYISGGRDQLLQIILTANGLDDLYNRVRLVSTIADQDQQLVSGLKDSSDRLDLLLKAQDDQKRDGLRLRTDLEAAARDIQATMAQRQQTLAAVNEQVAGLVAQDQARAKAEEDRLNADFVAKTEAAILAAQQVAASHLLNGGQLYQGTLPQTDNAITNQVVETAAAYLGIPYVWGGSKPSTGMDCSGFVRYVFKQHGVILPHYSGYIAQMGVPVALADIQPGDVVAFGSPVHHVGIYIGDGLFINTPGDHVKIQELSIRKDLTAIRRFPLQMRTGPPLFE
jgi:cell wall-associated NlpC family hydrolase